MTAVRALLRRELSAQLPWLLFFTVAALVRVIVVLGDDGVRESLSGDDGSRLFGWLTAFVAGAVIGDRDARRGAQPFLDTLPLPRAAFFAARAAVGVFVFVVADALMIAIGVSAAPAPLLSTSPSAVTLPLREVAAIAGASFVADVSGFAVGMLCAPLRQAAGIVVVAVMIVSVAASELAPRFVPYLPGGLGAPLVVAGTVVFVEDALAVWAGVAVAAFVAAGVVDAGRGRRREGRGVGRRARAVAAVVAVLTGLALWNAVPDREIVEVETRHARITAVAGSAASWQLPLWQEHVDSDLDAVEALVGARFGRRLRIDASGNLDGKHGQATGAAIALDDNAAGSRFVLAHEATHSLAFIVSGGAIADAGDGLESFSEGLANWVARQVAPDAPPHPDPRPALARLRRQHRLDDRILVDNDAALAAVDPLFVYGVGEELVGAMVDVYGRDAPRRFLEGLGPAVDADLRGVALWHAALAHGGMLFSPIAARFFARIGSLDDVDSAVAPFAGVVVKDGGVEAVAVDRYGAVVEGATCKLRNRPEDPPHRVLRSCRAAADALAGGVVEVQVAAPAPGGLPDAGEGAQSRWLRVPLTSP